MAEDRWLLTNKEIRDIVGEDQCNYATNRITEFEMVALVQDAKTKRKLVEWITSMSDYSTDFPANAFKIPKDKWQALRKEVGLDEWQGSGLA